MPEPVVSYDSEPTPALSEPAAAQNSQPSASPTSPSQGIVTTPGATVTTAAAAIVAASNPIVSAPRQPSLTERYQAEIAPPREATPLVEIKAPAKSETPDNGTQSERRHASEVMAEAAYALVARANASRADALSEIRNA